MLKLIDAAQTRLADAYTIENEPISSIELMERASSAFVKTFTERYSDKKLSITLFCGKGNNGGDGLAIARLLHHDRYEKINVVIVDFTEKERPDFRKNLEELRDTEIPVFYLTDISELDFKYGDIVIDAIFGTGLSRPLSEKWKLLIKKLNEFSGTTISVDVPSGMPSEGNIEGYTILKADWVITFQRPKLNFLLPLSAPYIKEWKVINIGLDEHFIENLESPFYWFWKKDIQKYIKTKNPFDHKGINGHNLIVAGSSQTMGAAFLCAEGSLRSGSGLTTVSIPESGLSALNSRLPEIMYLPRQEFNNVDWNKYQCVCVGSGLGKNQESKKILETLLQHYKQSVVFDADALNILAEDNKLLSQLPSGSVLTPHIKEFDRLFGEHRDCWSRIDTAFKQAQQLDVFIVLKNRYTMIFSPTGLCYFNSSGSPAMSIGGMGDVLAGMISSFIAQGYPIEKAVLTAVFIHGYAGEQLAQNMYIVTPSKLAKKLPYILKQLSNSSILH